MFYCMEFMDVKFTRWILGWFLSSKLIWREGERGKDCKLYVKLMSVV